MIPHLFKDGKFNSRRLRGLSPEEKAVIFQSSRCPSTNLTEAIFWAHHKLEKYPKKCKSCGKDITKFISFNQGYGPDFCSTVCSNSSKEVQQKKIQTSKEKYGTEFPWQSDEIKQKIKRSTAIRLSLNQLYRSNNEMITCPICSIEYSKIDTQHLKTHQLTKAEYFEKYGAGAPFGWSEELRVKKSGDNHPRSGQHVSAELSEKISNGMVRVWAEGRISEAQVNALGKYSASQKGEHHFNTGRTFVMAEEQKELISAQLLKYWETVEDRTFSAERLERYNDTTKWVVAETRKKGTVKKYLTNLEAWAIVTNFNVEQDNLTCICGTCNREISVHMRTTARKHQFSNTLCHTCYPIFRGASRLEEEVIDSLILLSPTLVLRRHDQTILSSNLELDIFLPEFKLAIEVDGVYWHSDLAGYDPKKHLLKTEECEHQGIQLIHIFESEWMLNQQVVLSRLANLLKLSTKVMGRRCEIRPLTSQQATSFFEANHAQGATNASTSLGLFYHDVLVAAMSFGKPRFNKHYEWELIRFASLLNTSVIGGAGKLLAHFERAFKPSSLISYADRRWSTGGLYRQLGFTLNGKSAPAYFYFRKNLILENRIKFQKHKLVEQLESYDPALSEWDNMKNHGFNRIWDCGNLVFVKEYA